MEERNELTMSPTGRDECFKTSHILKPSTSSTDGTAAPVPDSSSSNSKCLKRKNISPNTRSVSPPSGFARKHKGLSARPFSSTVNDRAEVVLSQGGSSKCPKGNGRDSPPPGFARKHNSGKEHRPGAGINEKGAEASSSSRCNQLQGTGPNIELNPSSGLEERISNIEKLLHWIKAGKLDELREIGKQLEREAQKEN